MSDETQTQYLAHKDTVDCPKDTKRKVYGKCPEGYIQDSIYNDCCDEYIQPAQPRTEEPYNYRIPKGQGLMTKFYPRNTNYNNKISAEETQKTLKRKRSNKNNNAYRESLILEERKKNYQEGLAFIEKQQRGLYEAKRINKEEEQRLEREKVKQEILDKK